MIQPQQTTIHMATDHAGYTLKECIKTHLEAGGYKVIDHGAFEFDPADDYPVFVQKAAEEVSKANDDEVLGIVLGGSGQGEAIAASRFPNIRTTVCYGTGDIVKEVLVAGRAHNNANVLSIGARFVDKSEVISFVDLWLTTPFTREERHLRRLSQLK
ncbi:MAG: RpiB/LacA/LacB family sugar-phosphate isomerase [Patescibacteria group bacterium]